MQDLTTMGDEELVEAYGKVREDILACDETGDDKGLVLAQAKHKPIRAELLRRLKQKRLVCMPGVMVTTPEDWDESAHIRSDSDGGRSEGAD